MSDECTILLAGAAGFVGQEILKRCLDAGMQLRALGRKPVSFPGGCESAIADLTDPSSLEGICQGANVVIHAAGYAHTTADPEIHWRVNFKAVQHLYRRAAEAGVRRFVFVSSVKAGGAHPRRCLDEDNELAPDDPYGQAKRAAEEWLLEQARAGGPGVVVIRPTLVYGPGVKGNLAAMLSWIDRGIFPPVPETGNRRSMVDVRDLVEAVLAAAERPEAVGGVYIISDGEDYSTRRIYEAMCRALGRRPQQGLAAGFLRGLGRIGDLMEAVVRRPLPYNSRVASRLLDSACYRSLRAGRELGFRPRYRLEDALPEMVEVFRAQEGG